MSRELSQEEKVYLATMADIDAVIDQEGVNYRSAQRDGNEEEMKRAFMAITAMRAQKDTAQRVAAEHAASLRPPEPQQRGGSTIFRMTDKQAAAAAAALTDDEVEAAAVSGMSDEEYAKNKAYMRWLNATGQTREGPLPRIMRTEEHQK